MVENASDDDYDDDEYGQRIKGAAVFIICSGGRYWDFSSHVDYNDFDVVYEVLDEDTGDFDSTTVTFNYRKWDVCYQYDPNTGSSYATCIGETATLHFNTPDPAFPTPN